MKTLKFVLIFVAVVIVLYIGAVLLRFLPVPEFLGGGIEGNSELKVTLLMDNNVKNPLSNIEVDVAKKPGPPPKGGVAYTNESGAATFKVKPGDYYIYFNSNAFPKNLKVPELMQVSVQEGAVTEKTVLITTAK